MKKRKIDKAIKILNRIEKLRSKNNKNWMDILRLAVKLDYDTSAKLIQEIVKLDNKIDTLAKEI